MSEHNFGEKKTERSMKSGQDIEVYQLPKYKESKAKAIEIIESGKYGVCDSDFWILMNEARSGKMLYSGLIISHNGCLKINDKLDKKFDPSCVSVDKEGYGNSLVFTYCSPEQGIYEVGEASSSNCKNAYPYAMSFKRMFDRVVLKLSRLAYAGIYSEVEADEFKEKSEDSVERSEEAKKKESSVKKAVEELRALGEKANVTEAQMCSICKEKSLEDIVGTANYPKLKAKLLEIVNAVQG